MTLLLLFLTTKVAGKTDGGFSKKVSQGQVFDIIYTGADFTENDDRIHIYNIGQTATCGETGKSVDTEVFWNNGITLQTFSTDLVPEPFHEEPITPANGDFRGQSTITPSENLVYFKDVVIKKQGVYLICRCSSSQTENCPNSIDYMDPVGFVTANGPDNVNEESIGDYDVPTQTVTSGILFSVHLTKGKRFNSDDRISIVPEATGCGVTESDDMEPALWKGITGLTSSTEPAGSLTEDAESWQNIIITERLGPAENEGSYIVCWCPGVFSSYCDDGEKYNVEALVLTVNGPTFQENPAARWAGKDFNFELSGDNLNTEDKIRIISRKDDQFLDTFGVWNTEGHIRCGSVSKEITDRDTKCSDTQLLALTIAPADSFDADRCLDACLANASCNIFEFKTNSGEDTDNCILFAGSTCSTKLIGQDSWDLYKKSSTHGPHVSSLGLRVAPESITPTLDANTNTLTWTGVSVTRAGDYRVCWCASTGTCTQAEHFNVWVADITVNGATFEQHQFTINSGISLKTDAEPDYFIIDGTDLQGEDVVIINTADCGLSSTTHPELTDDYHKIVLWGNSDTGKSTEFTATKLMFDPIQIHVAGTYNICWCQAATKNLGGAVPCQDKSDFYVKAGQITVNGPEVSTEGTIGGGEFFSANVVLGQPFTITITGTNLETTNRVMLVDETDTCDSTAPGNLVASDGLHPNSRVLGETVSGTLTSDKTTLTFPNMILERKKTAKYNICWCGDSCSSAFSSWQVLAGQITVLGPPYNAYTTVNTAGMKFVISLDMNIESGTDDGTDDEYIRIVNSADLNMNSDCGGIKKQADNGCQENPISTDTLINSEDINECYNLCLSTTDCKMFTWKTDYSCKLFSTTTCTTDSDTTTKSYTFADTVQSTIIFDNTVNQITTAQDGIATSSIFESIQFEAYLPEATVCWCSKATEGIGNDSACNMPHHFNVKVGTFIIDGPQTTNLKTATGATITKTGSGSSSSWTIHAGHIFSLENSLEANSAVVAGDSLVFVEYPDSSVRCGNSTETAAEAKAFHWQSDNTRLPKFDYPRAIGGADAEIDENAETWKKIVLVKKGDYRICWCPNGETCTVPSQHVVPLGFITIEGPNWNALTLVEKVNTDFRIQVQGTGLDDKARIRIGSVNANCGEQSTKTMIYTVEGSIPENEPITNSDDETVTSGNIEWRSIRVRAADTSGLDICYCKFDVVDNTCTQDHHFNINLGVVQVYSEAKSKRWRLYGNDEFFINRKWAWAVFELKLYSGGTTTCNTPLTVNVDSCRSSNNESFLDSIDDTNRGTSTDAFDDDMETYWQSLCGRYTTDTDVQPEIDFVCSDVHQETTDTTTFENRTAESTFKQQPFLEATFDNYEIVKCIRLTQVSPGGVRYMKKVEVKYYQETEDDWISLGTFTIADTDAQSDIGGIQ